MKSFFFFLVFAFQLQAAGPLMHLFLAECWAYCRTENFNDEDLEAFYNGTSYPDIRYLARTDEDKTHMKVYSSNDVDKAATPFLKGVALHSLVDELRNQVIQESGIYGLLQDYVDLEHRETFLKLIEDEVLWEHCEGRKYIPYLMTTLDVECDKEVSHEAVERWHGFIMLYLQAPPSQSIQNLASMNSGFLDIPPDVLARWSTWIPELAREPIFQNHVLEIIKAIRRSFIEL